MRQKAMIVFAYALEACEPSDFRDALKHRETGEASQACVEQIIEPREGTLIATLLRSYDDAGRIVEERLTDLHPDHHRSAPCFSLPSGYSRYTRTWRYDA